MPDMNRWIVAAPLSVLCGFVFTYLHVPAAWILAGIVGAGSVAIVTERDLRINEHLFTLARGVIGVVAALPLVGIPPGDLLPFLVPGLIAAVLVIAVAFFGGLVLANHGVSRKTGVLSLLPGGASLMPALARDLGADMRYVSLSQYLRLLTVSITLPVVVSFLDAPAASEVTHLTPYWWMWLLVPGLIGVGIPLGKLVRLPNPSIFGPMLVTVLVGSFADFTIVPPEPLSITAFLALGWMCGGGLSVPALKAFSKLLPATMAYIVGLMVFCAGIGWVVAKWLGLTLYEGYLATTPGALETALALSAEGGAGPAVVALQLIRLICVLIFAGFVPRILKRIERDD